MHGKRWSIKGVALASVFFYVLSFFFTMRPLRALIVVVVWSVAMFFSGSQVDSAPDAVQIPVFIALVLGPALVNMTILVKHRIALDEQPSAVQVA